MLIDVAISEDRNVIKKEAEKILKYKDLTIEIQGDAKKQELLKNSTKIEEIQEKKFIDRN